MKISVFRAAVGFLLGGGLGLLFGLLVGFFNKVDAWAIWEPFQSNEVLKNGARVLAVGSTAFI